MSNHISPPENHQIPTLNFDNLEVFSALGRGSKGVVFLVKADNKRLALKVILRESIESKEAKDDEYRRVSFEQGVLSRFDHPLFPRLHGVLSTDKVVGYAIDYCPGRDLNSLRKKQSEEMFSDEIIKFYAAELVIALEYLHNQGIVYRDLKPDNVMIQENGHLMLVDFDLSTNLPPRTPRSSSPSPTKKERSFFAFSGFCNSGISPDDSVSRSSESKSSGEKSNSFVGTEEYVAPEVIAGNGHDFAVDWWSLGVVLYEMLYGATPFKGSNRKETFFKILSEPPSLVGETTTLRDLVRKLLEKDPSRRINVEGIKGHGFFRGLDCDLVVKVSRPPYIPAPENYEISKIDVEKFVREIFTDNSNMKTNDQINNGDFNVF
ncbi:PREDICTED: serine/threonine-protein kinase OXI1-like isoform X1 [Camelina sativa]|uniref:non-specific serine/threonine protein kinase n=1 Tax=Camelina sativa TaxID=90675 RepID=A0ABM0U3N0_CAMSA|nr:PREDICTED: serine/threonine-protein kinase OXI1-like isoform X1 [Camelina sativa]